MHKATVWEHLQEFRKVLIRSLIVIALGMCFSFYYASEIVSFLTTFLPLQDVKLALFTPQEGMMAVFRLSFFAGLILTSPYWLFSLVGFIKPGLKDSERVALPVFIGLSFLFILCGSVLCLKISLPFATSYLYQFNAQFGVNIWGFSAYLDYTLLLLLAHALVFEMGVFLLLLIHLGAIHWESLAEKRRHAVIAALIMGAIISPPDVLTQVMIALPLYGFLELAILWGKIISRGHAQDRSYHVRQDIDAIDQQVR